MNIEVNNGTVVDAIWFNKVGIVAFKPNFGKVKYYIGPTQDGLSEEEDIKNIAKWGSKFYPEAIANFKERSEHITNPY